MIIESGSTLMTVSPYLPDTGTYCSYIAVQKGMKHATTHHKTVTSNSVFGHDTAGWFTGMRSGSDPLYRWPVA